MTYTNFINCENLDSFNSNLESGKITDSCIVFIQDPRQIWTHGQFYPCPYTKEEIDRITGGKYTADDILFTSDLVITADIGVHKIGSSGSKTLPTTGKSVKQVFDMLVAEEKNPTITQPSVSISFPLSGAKEVGTTITPSYTATLNSGSYQYGLETRVTATSWNITDTNKGSSSESSGNLPQFQVDDSTNYHITAVVEHTQGAVPVTNLGNEYEEGRIQASNKTGNSLSITGYRNTFYGTFTDKSELNSTNIRSLTKTNKALSNGSIVDINIPLGAVRVIIAYPSSLRDVTSIVDVKGMNADITSSFTKELVKVEGAEGYNSIDYNVYYIDYANPNNTVNTYKVTI